MWKMGAGYGGQADKHGRVFQAQVYYMTGLSEIKPQSQDDRVVDAKAWIMKHQQEGQAMVSVERGGRATRSYYT
jgi:hypothetical protein